MDTTKSFRNYFRESQQASECKKNVYIKNGRELVSGDSSAMDLMGDHWGQQKNPTAIWILSRERAIANSFVVFLLV